MEHDRVLVSNHKGIIHRIVAIDDHRVLVFFKQNRRYLKIFNVHTNKWTHTLPTLPAKQYDIGCLPSFFIQKIRLNFSKDIFTYFLYVIVGYEGLSTMWRINIGNSDKANNASKNLLPSDTSPKLFVWEKVDAMDFQIPRFAFATVTSEDDQTLFISGGHGYDQDGRVEVDYMDRVDLCNPTGTHTESILSDNETKQNPSWVWKRLANMPFKRRQHISVRVKNLIYILGGYGYVDHLVQHMNINDCENDKQNVDSSNTKHEFLGLVRDVHVFDIVHGTWDTHSMPNIPQEMNLHGLSVAVVRDRWIVLVSQGQKKNDFRKESHTCSCLILDTKAKIWFQGRGQDRKRRYNTAVPQSLENLEQPCNNQNTIENNDILNFMPGCDHFKVTVLENTMELILVGQVKRPTLPYSVLQQRNHFQYHQAQQLSSASFVIKSIPLHHLHPWFAVGELILLRKLVHEGRAIPLFATNQLQHEKRKVSYHDTVIQHFLIDIDDDVFKNVLSFLTFINI